YRTTANEIWQQTSSRITHFVAALGTSGTFVGTTRRLKDLNPAIRCVSLQPDASFHGLEGWKHMPTAIRPAIYDDALADENLEVSTEDAYQLVKRLAREEGLLVSPSAAAALLGCFKVAAGSGGQAPGREVLQLLPRVNRRDDWPRNLLSVTAEDARAAEKAAREQGLEVVGWYHSHPDHPARPSLYDRDHAWPWYSYIIVSIQNGAPQDMTSWRLNDDRAEFSPEEIEIRHRAAV